MRQQMLQGLNSVQGTVRSFSVPQRIIAVLGVAVLVLGGMAFMRWASTPTMVPIFTSLSPSDAGAISTELDAKGISYQMGQDGASIMVARSDVQNARIQLAQKGLPAGSQGGYAVLDNQGMNTSEFKQNVAWKRAMEGELSKTISGMDGIESAVVHLAIPEKDVFADTTPQPTASVMLMMPISRDLPAERVQSIVHLVSSSVPDMTTSGVTVVDSAGQLLSAAGGTGSSTMAEKQQEEAGNAVRNRLQAMLDKVVGPGNSVATAQVELDSDKRNTVIERFTDPDVKPLREKTTLEEYTGQGGAVTGVLGPDNVQGVGGGENAGDFEYKKETGTNENSVNKETIRAEGRGAKIARQSVSVMINTPSAENLDMAQLEQAMAAAAGIDLERGDTISVTQMPFDEKAAEAAAEALNEAQKAQEQDQLIGLARTGAIALAIIIMAIVMFVISRRKQTEDDEDDDDIADLRQLEPADPPAQLEAAQDPLSLPTAEKNEAYETMRDDLVDMVNQQPDEVAELLRGWLADRRS